MSAQGTTLQRRSSHLPVLAVAALLVIAVSMAIGLRVIDGLGQAEPVTAVGQVEAAVRELPRVAFHAPGRAHEVVLDSPVGATMPVQRLYPEGFGEATEDETTPIFDGRRRKW